MYTDTINNFINAFNLYSTILFKLFLLYRHVESACQILDECVYRDYIRCTNVLKVGTEGNARNKGY